MTHNEDSGPQFGETVYISKTNGARKVKSNAQVAMNKNLDPLQIVFLRGGWGGQFNQLNFLTLLELSDTSRVRKLILGLQVNTDTVSYTHLTLPTNREV